MIDSNKFQLFLEKTYREVKKKKGGKNASYIPELYNIDPHIYPKFSSTISNWRPHCIWNCLFLK